MKVYLYLWATSLRFLTFLKSSASTFEIFWLRFLQTERHILILIARTIVVEGNLPALLKDPFSFKTFRVQKKEERERVHESVSSVIPEAKRELNKSGCFPEFVPSVKVKLSPALHGMMDYRRPWALLA